MKPFADHFSRISGRYAAHRPRYPDRLFDALAEASPGRALAWDCAAGTGQAAVGLAGRFRCVVATDASPSQVGRGVPHPRIHYGAARAEAVPIRSGSVDLITVAQALHWLELDEFYQEARRVLVPGGLLAVWTYGRSQVDDGPIDAALDHFYIHVAGPFWPSERHWVDVGYRGLPFPFREVWLEPPEMTEDWTLAELLGYIGTWSAVVRCRETTGADPLAPLAETLAPLWGGPGRRRVAWPLSLMAGRP